MGKPGDVDRGLVVCNREQRGKQGGTEVCEQLFGAPLWVLGLANLFRQVYDAFRRTRLYNIV